MNEYVWQYHIISKHPMFHVEHWACRTINKERVYAC
nr:MAG TPA: hypothetical protein [Caudoviricetes sp.]